MHLEVVSVRAEVLSIEPEGHACVAMTTLTDRRSFAAGRGPEPAAHRQITADYGICQTRTSAKSYV
jgi:hypothetical protein